MSAHVADGAEAYLRMSPERRAFLDWAASETPELQERVAQVLGLIGRAMTDAELTSLREVRAWLPAPVGAE